MMECGQCVGTPYYNLRHSASHFELGLGRVLIWRHGRQHYPKMAADRSTHSQWVFIRIASVRAVLYHV